MTETMSKGMEHFHAFAKDFAVWLVTGVCAALAYSSWQTALAVERLVAEVAFIAKTNDATNKRIEANTNDLAAIRTEQRNRTNDVYLIADIERRLKAAEADLASRHNLRWNLPDQQSWITETARLNPDWKPAPIEIKVRRTAAAE